MEEIEKIKKQANAINVFLEMISEDERAPLEMKILNEDRKSRQIFQEIMMNKNFLKLSDDSEEKQTLYSFLKQTVQILTDIKNKID